MISKVFRAIAVTALACATGMAAAQAAELRMMQLASTPDFAQLSLDMSAGTAHKLFKLENPDRVVIDLPHTHLMPGFRSPHAAGVVSQVRVGPRPGGALRIVLQLRSALPATDAWGDNGGSP